MPLQVTSPAEFKKTALEDSLNAYCKSFNSTIDKLAGSDVKYCSVEFLRKEMQRLSLWGAMFAVDFIIERLIKMKSLLLPEPEFMFRFVQNREEYNKITQEMLNENTPDSDERIVQILHKSGPNIWEAVDIMLEFVAEVQLF